ncbi:type II secretion system minor pseudopilin GspI [Burkholderia glumae]|nr:type II secretion system minor pseudopilin GspI [Burkholderia glumae]
MPPAGFPARPVAMHRRALFFHRPTMTTRPVKPTSTRGGSCLGKSSEPGFTLIETLIALAIIAISFAAASRSIMMMVNSEDTLRVTTLAHYSADNELTEIRLREAWLPAGEKRYPCPQGNYLFICTRSVSYTIKRGIERIDISVSLPPKPHRYASMSSYFYDPIRDLGRINPDD